METSNPPDMLSLPWWLVPARLFDGSDWLPGRALRIENGLISDIVPQAMVEEGERVVRSDRLACPGYVDLQVNGGGGSLFNNAPEPETLRTIGQAHRRFGTTSWLPTFITDSADGLDRAVDAVIDAMGRHGIVGMHIEGPHINPARKGTHAASFIRPFDERTLASLSRLRAAGVPTLLTVAPECLPPGTIAMLAAMGVVVSAGHTAANAAEIGAALAEGLRCFTHLHNAMTPMTGREPGVVGAALDSEAWCGLIVDGHHVSDVMCALSLRAKRRPERMFLVSDAMATVGGPDEFVLYGERIRVVEGRLVNAAGALAGAHTDMARSVARLAGPVGLGLAPALRMATSAPAEAMGLGGGTGRLVAGGKADLLLLDEALAVKVVIEAGLAVG